MCQINLDSKIQQKPHLISFVHNKHRICESRDGIGSTVASKALAEWAWLVRDVNNERADKLRVADAEGVGGGSV